MKKITIKEIAAKAGVSPGTVDRVLHQRSDVSAETRTRVLQIAKEGGYSPNMFARHLRQNKVYTLGLLLPGSKKEDYWAGPARGMQQALEELGPLGISGKHFYFDMNSPRSFSESSGQLLSTNPAGVIFPPMFQEEARQLAAACRDRSIPFILIDSALEDSGALSFIGQHAFDSGRVAARLFSQMQLSAGQLAVVVPLSDTETNKIFFDRIAGFNDFFRSNGQPLKQDRIRIFPPQRLAAELSQFLEENPQLQGIFVPASRVHKVREACGGAQDKKFIGYDLTSGNLELLQKGDVDFLIYQRPEMQGYKAIQLLYRHLLLGQEVPAAQFMPIDIITRENLAYVDYFDAVQSVI